MIMRMRMRMISYTIRHYKSDTTDMAFKDTAIAFIT